MQHDDQKNRGRRDDASDAESRDELAMDESGPDEAWRPSDAAAGPSPQDEHPEQGGRSAGAPRGSGGRSEDERSDRTHQAPHEDHVGRADWAVEGSEGGTDPGAPPRREDSGEGSRRKKKS